MSPDNGPLRVDVAFSEILAEPRCIELEGVSEEVCKGQRLLDKRWLEF